MRRWPSCWYGLAGVGSGGAGGVCFFMGGVVLLVGLLTFDKFVGGHALAGTHEGRGDLCFDVCIDRAAFLATTGTHVKGLLAGAAVGGLGIDGHEDDLDALGLARLGRDGVAVGELAVVGRDNAAVFESDGAAFENPVDRDQFAVGERLTCGSRFGGGPAVGAQKKLVAFGHGDRPQLEDPKHSLSLAGSKQSVCPLAFWTRSTPSSKPRTVAELGLAQLPPEAVASRAKKTLRTLDALRTDWLGQLTPEQIAELEAVKASATGPLPSTSTVTADEALEWSARHHLERLSVVPKCKLFRQALAYGNGYLTLDDLRAALAKNASGQFMVDGEDVTTRDVFAAEQRMVAFVDDGKGACQSLNPGFIYTGDKVSAEQSAAVSLLLDSPDCVTSLHGPAGAGKTTTLKGLRLGLEAVGCNVVFCAPTAKATDIKSINLRMKVNFRWRWFQFSEFDPIHV